MNRMDKTEERRRTKAYRESKSDSEAARKLGLSVQTFKMWRLSRGFKSKFRRGRPMIQSKGAA